MTSPSLERPPSRAILSALLLLGVAIVFGQVVSFEFLSYDDPLYVLQSEEVRRGLTPESVHWAFTTTRAAGWHPFTWLSHMADVELWGLRAGGHHLGNVLLHGASTVLLFLTFEKLTKARWRSFLVAALFALHPLRADSVAWIAERKDTLSTFFSMLTLFTYARYQEAPSAKTYLPVPLSLAASLMSKATAVPLPGALLLLDMWPIGRWKEGARVRCVVEKLPLVLISMASMVVTFRVHDQAIVSLPFASRVAYAAVSYAEQLGHIFVPRHLAIVYPHPYLGGAPLTTFTILAAGSTLAWLVVVAAITRKRWPYVAFGVAWFLLLLFPLSGVVQAGMGGIADRFTYVAGIGILVAAVWLASDGLAAMGASPRVRASLAALVVTAYAAAAFVEVGHYRDSITVFNHAIESTGPNWMAEEQLGAVYLEAGDQEASRQHYQRLNEIAPERARGFFTAAHDLSLKGRTQEALPLLEQAVKVDPKNATFENGRCVALLTLGKTDAAVSCFQHAITLDPTVPMPYWNLAGMYDRSGHADEARSIRALGESHGVAPR